MFIFAPCGGDNGEEDGKDDDAEGLDIQDVEIERGAVLGDLDYLPSALFLAVEDEVHGHMAEEDTRNTLEVAVDTVDMAREDHVEGGMVILDHDVEVGVLMVHVPFVVASFGGERLDP